MKDIIKFIVLMTIALGASVPAGARGTQLYVAPNGNDANPGTLAKPFATLQRAQQTARKAAGREAVAVMVRAGTYYLPETLVLTTEDSGSEAAPVVYQAYEKEQAVVSGGIRLHNLKWEPYKDGIMQAQMPAGFTTDQLFVNGERQPMARYPDFDHKEQHFNGWSKDAFGPERAARWKDPAGGFIHALHGSEWGGMHYVITGKGPDNKITYEGGWQNNRTSSMHDIRFVENIFEELDAPGEWFLNSKQNMLYFYPPTGLDLAKATIEAVRLKHLIELRGTEQAPVNLVNRDGVADPEPAVKLAKESRRDEHSIIAPAMFIDPANGDFRVEEGSPALKLGFVNFPMDQFGVQKPELKAIARTPQMPNIGNAGRPAKKEPAAMRASFILQVKARNISGPGDRSAYGLPDETGVLILDVPTGSPAAKAGLQKEDVIRSCNEQPVKTVEDLQKIRDMAAGKKLTLAILRKQGQIKIELSDYAYVVTETAGNPRFDTVPLAQDSAVLPAKVSSGGASTNNDPIDILTDGKVANSYGPVFANGIEGGMYKLDLAAVKSIAQVNTFSTLDLRSQHNFVLYGSGAESDPGWKVNDSKIFTPVVSVDTRQGVPAAFEATSIRCSNDKPLGSYRWLVWVVFPVTQGNVENTAFQELQVIPAE